MCASGFGQRTTIESSPTKTNQRLRSGALGFNLTKAKCNYRYCKKPNFQMLVRGKPYNNPLLQQKVLPVFCMGTPDAPHNPVNRCLDRKGRLWDISRLPKRKRLTPFEREKGRQAFIRMGSSPRVDLLLSSLTRCTFSLRGKPGCKFPLRYAGTAKRMNPGSKKLYIFRCLNERCAQHSSLRYFDVTGKEVNRDCLPERSKLCPVCNSKLIYQHKISQAGGVRYDPPLYHLWCPNPRKIDHRTPLRPRAGTTFNYDPHRNRWIILNRMTNQCRSIEDL